MAHINAKLLDAIKNKTGLSIQQVYKRIGQVAKNELLPRPLAAIKLAADIGITINRYASAEELSQLRQAGTPVTPPNHTSAPPPQPLATVKAKSSVKSAKPTRKTPNQVFVVHGRDREAKDSMFALIRTLGPKPLEWNSMLAMTKKASPYIGEILNTAFANARAVVVLLTPDDLAQLRTDLLTLNDKPYERTPTGQARPNVLFEAGMAFATHPDQTVMVQLGNVREFSDTAGRHVVHMTNAYEKRQEFATKLRNAGCDVDTSGSDWVSVGDFTDPLARKPKKGSKKDR